MPIRFRDWLIRRGICLVEVPKAEFDSVGCNVPMIAPRRCFMLLGNPAIREALRPAGAVVIEAFGGGISEKRQSGPTCLLRPLLHA